MLELYVSKFSFEGVILLLLNSATAKKKKKKLTRMGDKKEGCYDGGNRKDKKINKTDRLQHA